MSRSFAELAFTPSVKAAQSRDGSRAGYERASARERAGPAEALGDDERAFIAAQRSFFLATVSETGWPYVQHRGGPPGFLRVADGRTLQYVELAGNRQFVSVGNLAGNDRVALILVDYGVQARLKILGRLSMREVDSHDAEVERLAPPELRSRAKRVMTVRVEAFDWNCSQYIPLLLSPEEVVAELNARSLAGS